MDSLYHHSSGLISCVDGAPELFKLWISPWFTQSELFSGCSLKLQTANDLQLKARVGVVWLNQELKANGIKS